MIRASALYIAIIIAAVIAIFSASLIATAYFYRLEYQKSMRMNKLSANLNSGISILLSEGFKKYDEPQIIDLFGKENDSLTLCKEKWGVFDLAMVKAFTLADTIGKTFLTGIRDKDLTALYLSDEDRPLSVSGSTRITGDALLPKAGIKQAYVEGKPFAGKKLVEGSVKTSKRTLPPLNMERLDELEKWLNDTIHISGITGDSVHNSFFNSVRIVRVPKSDPVIRKKHTGKIILLCDTTLTINREAVLEDIIVFAPAIVVKDEFQGNCQLFARDSIITGKKVLFNYPSCLGILKRDSKQQPKIVLGPNTIFSGIIFSWEEQRSDMQTMISLGKNSLIKGDVYASGFIKLEKPLTVEGRLSCNRFIIQTPVTLYENYLIDITLSRTKRSPYYLNTVLFENKGEQRVLKWLK